MKIRTVSHAVTILATAALLASHVVQGAELPVPAFYVKGDAVTGNGVPATLPVGDEGLIEGTVTSDGEALVFDGSGGQVTFGFDAENLFGNPFTVSAMVETVASNGYGGILEAQQPYGFGLCTVSHGHYSVSAGKAGAWHVATSAPKSLRRGSYQHVAVTYDGQAVVIYLDGLESGRADLEGVPKAGQTLVLGGMGRDNPSGGGVMDAPDSRLSRIAVFDSLLTGEQIQALADGAEIPVK